MNTPLTVLRGGLDHINKTLNYNVSYETRRVLDLMEKNISRLTDLSTTVSLLQEFDNKDFMINPVPFDLRGMLFEVYIELEPDFLKKKLHFSFVFDPGSSSEIIADHKTIYYTLKVLLANAVKFSDDDNTVLVQVGISHDQKYFEIRVKNTGDSLPSTYAKLLFEPFFTTSVRGIGLGLAVSKLIINEHNGHILLLSNRNQTEVIIQLPRTS